MRTLLFCVFFISVSVTAFAQQDFDLSALAGQWNYTYSAGIVRSLPLTLVWDGSNITGQTTYKNYSGKTQHDTFRRVDVHEGRLTLIGDQAGNPISLTGTLAPDGSFIRGDYHGPMNNGEFLLNRVRADALPDISGRYFFAYQAVGGKAMTGDVIMLCDNSGQLNGWLKLPDQEYHFEIKGTASPTGELQFSGSSKSREMVCNTTIHADGTLAKGQWSYGQTSGVFTLTRN